MEWDKQSFKCHPLQGSHPDYPMDQKYLAKVMRTRLKRRGMYNLSSPHELLQSFIDVQVLKYRSGIQLKCSPGLLIEIKRKAIQGDMDLL